MPPFLLSASAQRAFLDQRARTEAPVPASRSLAFLSLEPSVGVSTLARLALEQLRQAHADRLLLVDTSPGQTAGTNLQSSRPLPDALASRLPSEARQWLGYRDGIAALAFTNAEPSDWNRVVSPLVRHFDITCTDWGARPFETAARIARFSHTICLVASAEREAAEAAIALASAVAEQRPASRPVVALSDVTRTGSTWPRIVSERLGFPVVGVPYDDALRAGSAPGGRTRRSALALAAALMADPEEPLQGGTRW